jgi:hypothetical protein
VPALSFPNPIRIHPKPKTNPRQKKSSPSLPVTQSTLPNTFVHLSPRSCPHITISHSLLPSSFPPLSFTPAITHQSTFTPRHHIFSAIPLHHHSSHFRFPHLPLPIYSILSSLRPNLPPPIYSILSSLRLNEVRPSCNENDMLVRESRSLEKRSATK